MATAVKRLNARLVATVEKPGRYADGDGLYLVVGPGESRRWAFLFRDKGRLREMGLGSARAVSLAAARELAQEVRRVITSGRDPVSVRRAAAARVDKTTFRSFAEALVDEIAPGFRNAKHVDQWRMTLRTYAAPLKDKALDDIHTDDILAVLRPLWLTKQETASRLRGRIERVLDAAKARGFRTGENPARWRGHLDHLLPARKKLARGHHAAMPYRDVAEFVGRLRQAESVSALALEFLILAAARSGEVLGARWQEVDREGRIWVVPAERMKAGREHRVPLTGRMLEILEKVEPLRTGEHVFPGQRRGAGLSVMALEMVLRRMKVEGATVHGFRSSFRDWAAEETSFPREILEAALAHIVGDATERAYRRGDALERRRELMEAWNRSLELPQPTNVTALRRSA